jgi:small subunit ribosomal protein S4e
MKVEKKTHEWLIRPGPGPHQHEESIPLGVIVRDYLKLASNAREMKFILNNREVLVDGRVVKSKSFPVGLMDSVLLPKLKKGYRVEIDRKERLTLRELSPDEAGSKLCKIMRKVTGAKGRIMLGLHDGKTVSGDKNYRVGDTVKLSLPANKIEKLHKLAAGANCLVIKGKHAGKVAKLKELRTVGNRKCEAHMEHDGGAFITTKPYLFVVE